MRLPTTYRLFDGFDVMPCVDCHVGEPHMCPRLVWVDLVLTEDEYGAYSAKKAPPDRSRSAPVAEISHVGVL